MALIDFSKPATTDAYATAFVPNIQLNQNALSMWLDSTYITYANLPQFAKRYNSSTGLFEQYVSTTWQPLVVGYVLKAGDVMTGTLTFANNVALNWKDSGGTGRRVGLMSGGNNLYYGDVDNAITGGSLLLLANSSIQLNIAAGLIATVNTSGLTMASNTKIVLTTSTGTEVQRVIGSGAYLGFWNTANSTRMGYLQTNAASDFSLIAENGCTLNLGTNSAVRAVMDTSGNFGVNTGVTPPARLAVTGGSTIASLTDWNTKAAFVASLANPAVRFGIGYTAADMVELQSFDTSNAVRSLIINRYGGAIGIGKTPSSSVAIDLTTAGGIMLALDSSLATIGGYMQLAAGGTNYGFIGTGAQLVTGGAITDFAFRTPGNILFAIGSQEVGRFTSSGNLALQYAAATLPKAMTMTTTTATADMRASNVFTGTLTGNIAAAGLLWSNFMDGQTVNFFLTQDGTGSRTITWPSSFKWPGGTAGVLSTAANAVDLLVVTYRAATGFFYCTLAKGFA